MAAEPVGCTDTPCGGTCPSDKIATFSKTCSEGTIIRCCPESSYPDVMLLVDRGNGQRSTFLQGNHPEDSLLTKEWTTAKQLLALPGEGVSVLEHIGTARNSDSTHFQWYVTGPASSYLSKEGMITAHIATVQVES